MTTLRLAAALMLALTASARAVEAPAPEQAAVKKYLDGVEEKTEVRGSALGDLDGDGTPELVFVWTTIGSKFPMRTLTVLAKDGDGWREAAATKLEGEVALNSVANGIIVVDRWPLHPPKCCPSKKFADRYMLMAGRVVDAK
jgi:hypothetical protein